MPAVTSRFTSALDGLRTAAIFDPVFQAVIDNDLDTGVHRNPLGAARAERFTLTYFHHPDELHAEVAGAGFADVLMLAVEGPIPITDTATLNDPARRSTALRTIERIESERTMLGASPHLMAVGVAR